LWYRDWLHKHNWLLNNDHENKTTPSSLIDRFTRGEREEIVLSVTMTDKVRTVVRLRYRILVFGQHV